MPRARYVVILVESDNHSGYEINNFEKPGTVYGGTVPIDRYAVSHARDDQPLNNSPHDVLREEMSQVTEADQEAGTVANHGTDVRVSAQMTIVTDESIQR